MQGFTVLNPDFYFLTSAKKTTSMKKTLLAFAGGMLTLLSVNAQTPANFNGNDCSGNNHDLYAELASGKVIVVAWVMPCTSCLGPTLTASNVVQSYASSNPGQVLLYVADDAANTACSSINSWVNSNGITANATFSNSSVVESNYGTGGMPKIVVFGGGSSPATFFNQNGSAAGNSTALQSAINSALATGINDPASSVNSVNLFPNPANATSTISFVSEKSNEGNVTVYDQLGQKVMNVFSGAFIAGENKFEINTAEFSNGIYFIKIKDAEASRTIKLVVSH